MARKPPPSRAPRRHHTQRRDNAPRAPHHTLVVRQDQHRELRREGLLRAVQQPDQQHHRPSPGITRDHPGQPDLRQRAARVQAAIALGGEALHHQGRAKRFGEQRIEFGDVVNRGVQDVLERGRAAGCGLNGIGNMPEPHRLGDHSHFLFCGEALLVEEGCSSGRPSSPMRHLSR